ncbi:MAG: hypothetical protein UY41_C0005G0013 [Candidatus Moranbacteria bacterium GW2011_GWE1_49_15]|nr:MAG: hypothetical protein UX75_C0001G0018 [Candidatus Moranbacteria bacterium GW2011_GWE2_47_10]KKW07336.1 MAG: hypothetical protein UY41_C0005G0013 [Candidatus Moranbacteria bacterium GW2011_GWE1_49_15]
MLSGAVSNMLDRLIFGCVRDFIPFIFDLFYFNAADTFIAAGFLFFLIFLFKSE